MPWFLNISPIVQSVAVGNGNTIGVLPNEKVEVLGDLSEMMRLVGRGVFRKSSPGPKKSVPETVPDLGILQNIVAKTDFSTHIAEKGVTISPKIAPVSERKEMTEGEVEINETPIEKAMKSAADDGSKTMSADDEAQEKVKSKRSRRER